MKVVVNHDPENIMTKKLAIMVADDDTKLDNKRTYAQAVTKVIRKRDD